MSDTMNQTCMTPVQVAVLVKIYRNALEWTQETLAELSGLTVRTVQRVEAGDPSSTDTRRAIARAMEIPDLDVFNKPWPFTSEERRQAYEQEAACRREELEKDHILLDAHKVNGRGLVTLLVDDSGFLAMCPAPMEELPAPVQDYYAQVVDYFRDCMDIADVASRQEMLSYGDEISRLIKDIEDKGYMLLATKRNLAEEKTEKSAKSNVPDAIIYLAATKKNAEVKIIAVPRDIGRMAF